MHIKISNSWSVKEQSAPSPLSRNKVSWGVFVPKALEHVSRAIQIWCGPCKPVRYSTIHPLRCRSCSRTLQEMCAKLSKYVCIFKYRLVLKRSGWNSCVVWLSLIYKIKQNKNFIALSICISRKLNSAVIASQPSFKVISRANYSFFKLKLAFATCCTPVVHDNV